MAAESKLESAACKYAEQRGIVQRKFSSPGRRAVPDRLLILPGGKAAFIEFKAPGKRPTKLQLRELAILAEQGCDVCWVDDLEKAKMFIDKLV